ncbi:MAG TPA: hypothetical protein DD636_03730 [Anaerolineaceae bacterium]|jgi:4-amino-4-deoxy-L-arabinose transferase-like glycosyltransferase|nr:hypothetical protein [Anaerolineaceae bacterium]
MASKKYIKDYDLVETEDEKGRVKKTAIYSGEYFRLNLEESQIKQLKLQFILFFVAALALHVGAGLVNNPGLYKIYMVIPYTGSFLPLFFLAEGILRIPGTKRAYRNEEMGLSYQRVVGMSRFYLILMGIGMVGALAYLIFASNGQALEREALYIGLALGAALLVWLIFRRATEIVIEKEETPINSK